MTPGDAGALAAELDRFRTTILGRRATTYVVPSPDEHDRLAGSWTALEQGDLTGATRLAASIGMSVDVTSDGWVVLRDARRRGWGLYALRLRTSARVRVEVVHPISDLRTFEIGAEMSAAPAVRSLFVAGAHRDAGPAGAADPAHAPTAPLLAVHRAAVRAGDVVVQPHGFDESSYPESFGDVVVSDGSGASSARVSRVARDLEAIGLTVCVSGGGRCRRLAARENLEGRATRGAGGYFLHLELSCGLREDSRTRRAIARTVITSVTGRRIDEGG